MKSGTKALFTATVCLAAAVLGVWAISAFVNRGGVPREEEFDRLCAVNAGVEFRKWTHIVVHHSATDKGDAASFDRYHRNTRGWRNGLGYDFVIGNGTRSGDGEIEVGDRWRRQIDGAHCEAGGMNQKAVGICFVGNFEEKSRPTKAQIDSGTALVRYLAWKFSIPPENILGHGEVPGASTQCPGRHFPTERLRAAARGLR